MRNLILLIANLTPFLLAGQDTLPPIRYGVVPPEDLAMKTYPPDSAAAAVVLGDYGTLHFVWPDGKPSLNFTRHKRFKFFRRAGFDHGSVQIPYFSTVMKIKNLKIQVFAPDGTVTEVPPTDIFDEELSDRWRRIRFAFPNLKEGCVAEYTYELESEYFYELPEWYFQGSIPVRWSELRLAIPMGFEYITLMNGRKPDIMESRKIDIDTSGIIIMGLFNHIRFVMKEVPALREEHFITTMDDYYSRVRFQLKSYRYDQKAKQMLTGWTKAAADLMEIETFGGQLTKKSKYKKAWSAARPMLETATTAEEKIVALYNFILKSFEFGERTSLYASQDLNDLFEKKNATPSEANLLLVALLREAGLQAYPVLASTRDHGQTIRDYPILDQFNHVLAWVEYGGKSMLLDAGNPFRPPGMVAANSLNKEGWKVHPTKPEWIAIEAQLASEIYYGVFRLDEEGSLAGKVQIVEEGYSAVQRRIEISERQTTEYWETRMQTRHPDARLDSVTIADKDELTKPLRENFNCVLPAYAQVSGDFMYLTPVFYSSYQSNLFKTESRVYPIDMPYPLKERVVTELIVPPGYRVESLPEPARLSLPDNAGRFQYSINQQDGKITLNALIHLTQVHFEPNQYDTLRSFFGMIAEKFGEQVVLKKL